MPPIDTLIDEIFAGQSVPLREEFTAWVHESRRYKAFVTTYRAKIRAKLRHASTEQYLGDVRAELETAATLLHEPRFSLEYETYAASKQRGPDFTVTYRTHTPFNVEVRRLRMADMTDADAETRKTRIMTVLCDKAGQMPPGIVNVLWLIGDTTIDEEDVQAAMLTLRQLAERKNDDYFARYGFVSAADFLKHYQQLTAVVLRQPAAGLCFRNPLARAKLLPEIETALLRSIG